MLSESLNPVVRYIKFVKRKNETLLRKPETSGNTSAYAEHHFRMGFPSVGVMALLVGNVASYRLLAVSTLCPLRICFCPPKFDPVPSKPSPVESLRVTEVVAPGRAG